MENGEKPRSVRRLKHIWNPNFTSSLSRKWNVQFLQFEKAQTHYFITTWTGTTNARCCGLHQRLPGHSGEHSHAAFKTPKSISCMNEMQWQTFDFYYYCYYDWQEYVYLNTNTTVKGKPDVSNFKCDDVDTVLSHDLWGKISHRNPNINHFLFCDFLHLFPIPSMTCADMNEPVYDHSDENEAAKSWSFSYFLCF